jgi:hypothetical protein
LDCTHSRPPLARASTLLYTGQSGTGTHTGLVTYKLTINGNVNLKHDNDGSKTGLGKSAVSLVE